MRYFYLFLALIGFLGSTPALAANEARDNYPMTAKIQKRMREIEQSKQDLKL